MSSITTTNSNDLMIDESTKVSSSFSFKDSLVRSSSNPSLNSESDSLEKIETRFEKHKCHHHHHRHHRHHHHHRSTVTTNMNKIPNQNANQIPYQNSHQIPYQNLNQISDQNLNQISDQNLDQNPNLDNNQSTSQSSNLNLNQKSKRSKRTVQTEQPKSSKIPLPSVESSSVAPLIFEIKVKLAKLEELYRKNGAQMSLYLDTILNRLDSSENLDVVIGSLSTLNEILCPAKDLVYSYERYLKGRVDRIVLLCAKQYRFFFTVYLTPDSGQNLVLVDQIQQLLDSNSNLLNYLLCTCPVQLEGASRESLHQLMQSIIPFLAWHHQLSRDCNKKKNHFRGIYFDSVQNLVNELLGGISTNFRLLPANGFNPKPTDRILVIGILFRMLRDLTTKFICTENGKTKKQIKLSIDALTSLIHNQRFESNSKDSCNIQMVVYEIYSLFEVYSNFDEENEMSRILRCVESYLSSIFIQLGTDSAWKHFDLVDHELTVTKRNFENVPVFKYLANQGFMRNPEFVPKSTTEAPVSRIVSSHTLSKVSSSYWENFEKFHIVHRRLMEKYLTDADSKRTEKRSKKSKMNLKPQQIRVQPKSVTPPETLKLIDLATNEFVEKDSGLPKSPTGSSVSYQCPKTVPNGTNNRKLKVQITKSLRPTNLKFVLQSTPNSVEESDTVSGIDSNAKHSENKTDFLSNVVESLNMTISGLNLENPFQEKVPLETNEIQYADSVSESDDSNDADDDDPKRSTDSFVNLNLTDWSKEIEEFQKSIDSDPEMVMLDLDDGPLAQSLCPELVKFFSDEPIQEEEDEKSFEILKTPEPETTETIKMVSDSEIPETEKETKQNPTVDESNPTASPALEESTIRSKVQKTTGMHKFEKTINELLQDELKHHF